MRWSQHSCGVGSLRGMASSSIITGAGGRIDLVVRACRTSVLIASVFSGKQGSELKVRMGEGM